MTEEIVQEKAKPKRRSKKATTTTKTTSKSKTTPKKSVTKKTTSKAKTTSSKAKKTSTVKTVISADERHQMICEAAYYIAEKRGFSGGNPEEDWVEAETKIQSYFDNA